MKAIAALSRVFPALLAAAFVACGGGGGGGGNGGGGTPLNITSTAADDGVIGVNYSGTIMATGGTGAKTFTLSSGALPAGLAMSGAGVISGTPAGPAGRANFTVSVTDSATTPATDAQALTIDIVEPLAMATTTLPGTAVGAAYSEVLTVSGGTPPYQFQVPGGELPAGMTLSADGTLTGPAIASAHTQTFTIQVLDSSSPALLLSRDFTIAVALEITTVGLPDASGGEAYSVSLTAQGGQLPYLWSRTSGTLPAGLSGPAPTTGTISGTPTPSCTPETSTISVGLQDSASPPATDTLAGLDITMTTPDLLLPSGTMPAATVGKPYDTFVDATGGKPPYSFALAGGLLPNQLSLTPNGRITGTPDTVETQAFQVTVTDVCPRSATRTISLTVNSAALGRNDSIAQATNLPGNGTYSASISPSGDPNTTFDPDQDYYRIHTNGTSTVTIDVNAQVNGSPLDPVIEVVNSAGAVLNQCGSPAFTTECISDDEVLGIQRDSFLQVRVTGAATFYIHVLDWSGNARPDFVYDLVISGVN